ncbi:hypothetical protein HOI71_19635, partial [Candidatus Poribacteria bacterium]|nr:hypothetical protein [Candidatus Poribacteria bacterium]
MRRVHTLLLVLSLVAAPRIWAADASDATVVYLKNGSIVRGRIVTLVPGTSVSLETRDGNLFVWEMAHVERIESEY